jgi:predicted ATPase/DNA-binding winged helix-turn-helix (wHTH) protein
MDDGEATMQGFVESRQCGKCQAMNRHRARKGQAGVGRMRMPNSVTKVVASRWVPRGRLSVVRATFGCFVLDDDRFDLLCEGKEVPLEPQVFNVLTYLVRHHDRVVTKEELLDAVWGDRFVSESALTSRIRAVRRALGDDRHLQRYVMTVHRRGYRFVAEVQIVDAEDSTDREAGAVRFAGAAPNLPAERTPLFGREQDIESVAARVGNYRLLSLLGIGGTGKTRVAVAVGRSVVDRFPDGVWFADLVPVDDSRSVDSAVAHAAGIALRSGDSRVQLAEAIRDRDALFILDNCEHVRDQVAALVDYLLEQTTMPHFLITSRVPLDLADESRVRLEPLDVGDEDEVGPAIELFLASAERFGAAVDHGDLGGVRRICQLLDGLPLALELAAAQLRVLGPDEVLARLDERFELLHTSRTGVRQRQASLLAVLTDTWEMLDPDEVEVLGRLAAFPGPFDLMDAEQLTSERARGSTARVLGRLVDRSLLVSEPSERRHRLLDTVRLFTRKHSDEQRHATRHADWCLDMVGPNIHDHLFGFSTAVWCHRHWDDLRAAEQHLLHNGRLVDAAMLVAAPALAMHVDLGSRGSETLRRLEAHLDRVDEPALAARLHITGATSGLAARSPKDIAYHGHAAVDAARQASDDRLLSIALVHASWSTVLRDAEAALAMVEDASRRADAAGDPQVRALTDGYRAIYLALIRRYGEALMVAEAVVARSPPIAVWGWPSLLAVIAISSICVLDEPDRAAGWVADLTSRPSPELAMWGIVLLAASVHASGRRPLEAVALIDRVHARLVQAGQDWLPDLLIPAAVLAYRAGAEERAARWVRAVRDAGRPTQSFPMTIVYRRLRETVGMAEISPLEDTTLDEVGDGAFAWVHDLAG